jgi:hypothetical protein
LVLFFGYTLKWYSLLIIYISSSHSFTMCVSHGQGNQQGKQRKQPQIWD